MNNLIKLLSISVLLFACEAKPVEINYGADACHFCKMTIVDKQHAAQLVTVKGRAFKYDAIECMMNDLSAWDGPEIKFYLAADYSTPGNLIDATGASFLVSEAIPSPMGEFLSAFYSKSELNKILESNGGEALSWEDLQIQFDEK